MSAAFRSHGPVPKLVAVQVLRAAAALAVVFLHAEHEARLRAGPSPPWRLLPWDAGVDVFFVISGFVMVYASGPLFARPGGARAFLARRVARIVPLYWLATTLFLAVYWLRPDLLQNPPATPGAILASYAFWPQTRPDGLTQPVYSLGWTLNYEMFFYAVFALAIGLRRRPAILAASAALIGFVLAGRTLGPWPEPLRFWSDPILYEFCFGMWLGWARAEGVTLPGAARLALGAGGLAVFALGSDALQAIGYDRAVRFGLPGAMLVAACGLAPDGKSQEEGRLARLGGALGDASYAAYLVHPFVVRGFGRMFDLAGAGPALGRAGFVAGALLLTVGVSLLVHRALERPLTAALRRRLEPARPPRDIDPAASRDHMSGRDRRPRPALGDTAP